MRRSPLFLVNSLAGIIIFAFMLGVYDNVTEELEPAQPDVVSTPLCEVSHIDNETGPVKAPDPGTCDRENAAPPRQALFGDWDTEAAGLDNLGWTQRGIASWYGEYFHEGPTASGETYDMYTMTAAHRKLPFNTFVEVTRLDNDHSVVVRINNRGPYAGENRIIDLSKKAADKLGMKGQGLAEVEIEIIEGP